MSNSDPVKELIAGIAPEIGESFFKVFIEHLAKAYGAEYALANQLINTAPVTVRTLAFWKNGEVADNFEYKVETTPCEMVYKLESAYYPNDIQEIFFKDEDLVHMGVNSYLGTLLHSHEGEVIGHICVLGKNDVAANDNAHELLKAFSARAAAELERIKLEQELLDHRDNLKKLVDEKTKEIKLAYNAAEQASLAKSEFMSRMSHELRTPLNAIIGYSELLFDDLQDQLNNEQSQRFEAILSSSWNLLHLIEDVLDLSKLEVGELHEDYKTGDINALINDVISVLQDSATRHQVTIKTKLDDSIGIKIKTNLIRLHQVLVNLISNAIKFNHINGTIDISTEITPRKLRINITDSGIGLNENDQAIVFEKFERLQADKDCIPGSGIGLAITKRLIEHMGGEIGIDSEINKGATFWIEIPISD